MTRFLSPQHAAGALRWHWLRLLPLLVIAAAVVAIFAGGWSEVVSLETLVRRRAELNTLVANHYWVALGSYIGVYILVVLFSLPTTAPMSVTGGVMFGWLVGGMAAVVGATVGAVGIFLLARYAVGDFIRQKFGRRLTALADGFRADAFGYLLFLRLVPLFPFWFVNLAPAVAGVPLSAFVPATLIGILPATFTFALFGAGIDHALGVQERLYEVCLMGGGEDCRLSFDLGSVVTPRLVTAFLALGVLALLPVIIRRWRWRS